MGLPLVQVFMIAARQLSKPVADRLMTYGKNHPFCRDKILVPIGRKIINMTTRLRMKNLGLVGPATLSPVSEAAALEQSSEFIQQVVIFGYSVGVFAAYHYYTKLNEREVVAGEDFRRLLSELDTRFAYLESRLDQIDNKVEDLKLGVVGKLFRSKSEPLPKQNANHPPPLMSSLPFDEALKKLSSSQSSEVIDQRPGENKSVSAAVENRKLTKSTVTPQADSNIVSE